jgi:hypothetical protein
MSNQVRDYIDSTHLYLGVEAILTQEEKDRFLKNAYTAMPNLQGAPVADVIDILNSHDAHLGFTETTYEEHATEIQEYGQPRLFTLCCFLAIYIDGPAGDLWAKTKVYMDRWVANRCGHVWYEAPQATERPVAGDYRVRRTCTLDKDHLYPVDHHDRRAPNF